MTIALTQDALKKLANGFGENSPAYNVFVFAAQKSAFFAGELNAFGALKDWKYSIIEAGKGVSTDAANQKITFAMDWSESSDVLATTLAHELGHALLKGGTGGSGNTPAEAQATSHTNEGVALQAEYIVATQLGLKGGATGNMHSDFYNKLTPQLNDLSLGIDVAGMLYGSSAAMAFTDPSSAQVIAAGIFSGNQHPSIAPLLTYDQFTGGWSMVRLCKVDPDTVDWITVKPEAVAFETYLASGLPVCRPKAIAIPLKDGTTMNISGEISPKGIVDTTVFWHSGIMKEQAKFDYTGFKLQDVLFDTTGRKAQQFDFNLDKSYASHVLNVDGSQTAALFGIDGQMTQYTTYRTGDLFKTQDLSYTNGKLTKQLDFNFDHSYASHVFNPDGSQVAALFGVSGQMTLYTTYRAGDLFKTQDLIYTDSKLTKEIDYNTDHSYASHVFNPDGSQVAALFGVSGQMTQYTTYRAGDLFKSQDLIYTDSKLIKEIDYNTDHSYASHVFNSDGSQVAALFGVNGQMTQYTTYRAGDLFKTQDLIYTNNQLTKQIDYNIDHSYASHVFNSDGSQVAALFGVTGQMTQYSTYRTGDLFKTQDLLYTDNKLIKQFDYNFDHSYASHVFNSDGSQVAALFGVTGQMTQYTTYRAGDLFKTQDLLYTNNKLTKQVDYKPDHSYTSQVFNLDGSHAAGAFGANNKMNAYSFYDTTNFNSQNISYYENGNKKLQYDFKLDKSYAAHTFNPDGSQIATLFGIDQKVSENATFSSALKLTQDVFYTGGVKTKGYEFNIDGTYSAHIFTGNQENVSAFSADNKITGYSEYQGTWQKNSTFYNSFQQPVETDRYNTSHALTGFTQFTYNANNTYTGHNFDSVGHAIGESTYTGSGAFISGAVYTHSGGGMQLSSGGGNLFASFQI